MSLFYFIVQQTLIGAIPLLVVALGGIFSERGGILNFSLEGIMLAGAFVGTLHIHNLEAGTQGDYVVAALLAGVAGMAIILPHAISSISLNGNQIISGMAINLLTPAATTIIGRALVGRLQVTFTNSYIIRAVPGLSGIPVLGGMFFQNTYVMHLLGPIVLVLAIVVLNYTRFGMHLKACGENPEAAASTGINVTLTRYIGVMISGFIAGMGGLIFIIPNASEFASTVSGYGYLAVAVVIFGQWQPMKILFAAIFFGLMKTMSVLYTIVPVLSGLGASQYIYKMIPYVATIVVLFIITRRSSQPSALGLSYE